MIAAAAPNALAELAGKLTDPLDRQTYAALISFIDSLPENDELFRMAQLLGLLSLVGERIPASLEDFLAEFRAQTAAAASYHAILEARLAGLPGEIAVGVDASAIAKAMSEAFRQQLAATGLQETTALLQGSVNGIKGLAGQMTVAFQPLADQHKGVSDRIAEELAKLQTTANRIQQTSARLRLQERENSWLWKAFAALVLLLVGFVSGSFFERSAQISDGPRIQQPAAALASPTPPPTQKRKTTNNVISQR